MYVHEGQDITDSYEQLIKAPVDILTHFGILIVYNDEQL